MYSKLSLLALAATAAAIPQGVTDAISPSHPAPAGCSTDKSGTFQITTVNVTTSKRDLTPRADILTLTLSGSVLKDSQGRIGYIASNRQFQFDAPPQAGSIYTSGFSLCGNNTLALGGSAIWYQCYSGGFYNLYDQSWAPQCSPIYIEAMGGSAAASQSKDGQPAVTGAASQLSDGQPRATPVTQLTDGQPQGQSAATGKPVTQLTDGQPQASSAGTAKPVTQLSDGQPQATSAKSASSTATAKPVTQLSDGQPQASSAKPASSSTAKPVTQITDGQVQATAASNRSATATSPVPFTGGAPYVSFASAAAGLVGLAGVVLML